MSDSAIIQLIMLYFVIAAKDACQDKNPLVDARNLCLPSN